MKAMSCKYALIPRDAECGQRSRIGAGPRAGRYPKQFSVGCALWHCGAVNLRTIISAVLILLASFQAPASTLTGNLVKVSDGDTITILVGTEQHRIRLQGIDAPERK